MKYISYSLWGKEPIYNVGIIRNAEQYKEIYTDWQMIVYHNNSVPIETIKKLNELGVKCINAEGKTYGMFWRFYATDIEDADYVIFRDADSRLSIREKLAVDEWIESGKTLHVMRDHPAHYIPYGTNSKGILGGMWGIKKQEIKFEQEINIFCMRQGILTNNNKFYGSDQAFLKSIYIFYNDDMCVHDEFFDKKPFPIPRENGRFIGERIDINEQPLTDDYKVLL